MRRTWAVILCVLLVALAIGFDPRTNKVSRAQTSGPTMLVPNLAIREVVGDLVTPIAMAFIGSNDFFLLEKNTGKVQHFVDGAFHHTPLDLAVNFASERGLLAIALHPGFPDDPGVYLYWTESTTDMDTNVLSETPLLGNRVDRFLWNGQVLTFDRNLLRLRAIQQDEGQPERGNHDDSESEGNPLSQSFEWRHAVLLEGMKPDLAACDPSDDGIEDTFVSDLLQM